MNHKENEARIEILNKMKSALCEIKATQSRPENHRCINLCYQYRNIICNKSAEDKINSAHEYIKRRKSNTFEDIVLINEICAAIDQEIFNLSNN